MKPMKVEPIQASNNLYRCNTGIWRAMLLTLAILPVGCNKDEQAADTTSSADSPPVQATATPAEAMPLQPAPAPVAQPLTDLESLVAPIALYPDPLLAEFLLASTYPLEVVQAARWLETKPDLSTLSSKNWDASVMRLTSVPIVIKMMDDHLDWTTQLGDAFLAKPTEVMDTIQTLRKRATDAGYLKDTPEQKVTAKTVSLDQAPEASGAVVTPAVMTKEVITIEPAKTDTIYVPQYNPATVYQAPLAPPPTGTTVVNVNNSAAPASSYYPTYYPAPATTTTSSNDAWMNFAKGAVVGGLLTWGIMEWTNNNNDYYHVGHYYGNSVCHNGNCWSGNGGYYGDRGNVNYNRNSNVNYNKNVNVSGNEINIGGGNSFSQNNLRASQQPAGWQPNSQHRRGQAYPDNVQKRLGGTQQPALAGQRLGAAQTLPANARGYAQAGQRPAANTLPAGRRPSSADIQQQLAQKPGAQGNLKQNKPTTRDIQTQLGQGAQNNAFKGGQNTGRPAQLDSQRGSQSRKSAATAAAKTRPTANQQPERGQRKAQTTQLAGQAGNNRSQQLANQRRSEAARPSAFDAPRNKSTTQSFSQRGASSVQRSAGAGNARAAGGVSRSGGGARSGGGGARRR